MQLNGNNLQVEADGADPQELDKIANAAGREHPAAT